MVGGSVASGRSDTSDSAQSYIAQLRPLLDNPFDLREVRDKSVAILKATVNGTTTAQNRYI